MASRARFDLGPLSWVKGEIDSAMQRGLEALASCAASAGEDRALQLKASQAHLHQVRGALQIIGLEGVTRVAQQLESLLADLARDPGACTAQAFALAERVFHAIRAYLDELIAGKPHQPLRLMPAYSALLDARGAGPADPIDLYFPDLSRSAPRPREAAPSLHPEERKQALREQRTRYQRGLLGFLRGDRAGAQEMRAALETIELIQGATAQRTFWWVARGFCDALMHDALPPAEHTRLAAKRLCNRIEQQIRLLCEGTYNVAERLLREALYLLAQASPASEQLREMHEIFGLAGTLPAAQERELPALSGALGAASELHARAKDHWDRFVCGQAAGLAAFCEAAMALSAAAAELRNPALSALLERIAAAAEWLSRDPSRMSEALALEQATALLFAGHALEDFGSLGDEFGEQARLLGDRLTDCIEGRLLRKALDIPLLDDLSRRAQEALIARQALAETQVRLRSVEQLLERIFRDPSQRSDLAQVGEPFAQIDRALELLGESRAKQALAGCGERIRQFSASDFVPSQPEFARSCEAIAQTLSGLGSYCEALLRGSADFDQAMSPVSATPPGEEAAPQASLEEQLAHERGEARRLAAAWKASPGELALEQELHDVLITIKHDAALVVDGGVEAAAEQALRALEAGPAQPEEPQLLRALDQIAPQTAPPAPSPAAERLAGSGAQSSGAALDAELLAVYLEEADQLIAKVGEGLEKLRAKPTEREVLAAVRRCFHTLKGSARMVGLSRLGEAAWAVEQTLNLRLQQEGNADRALLDFVESARAYFADAVARMLSGRPAADESALLRQSEALRRGEPASKPAESAAVDSKKEEALIQVGAQRISATLFTLFSGEARMRLATLKEEQKTLQAHGVITDEMLGAAHALAESAGSVQLRGLYALALAFDQALSGLSLGPLSSQEETLIEQTIDALEQMVMQALELTEPIGAPELVARLEQTASTGAYASGVQGGTAAISLPEEEAASHPGAPAAAVSPSEDIPGPALAQAGEQAAAARIAGAPDSQLLPAQLLPDFLEEAAELIASIDSLLREWSAEPGDSDRAQALRRALHTLKGSARTAGAMALGELTHEIETRIGDSFAAGAPAAPFFEELHGALERIRVLLAELQSSGRPSSGELTAPGPESEAMLRVRSGLIDELVDEAGEMSIARSRIEGEIGSLRATLAELTDNVARLRRQLRELEIQAESRMASRADEGEASRRDFDPLEMDRFTRFQELTRMMAESVNDVHTAHQNLLHVLDATDAALASQARLNRELQRDLMRVRMLPLASLAERLNGSVRQTARDLGKNARLDIRGETVLLDRSVLERIAAPLEHLLRNAVTHGIESPQARAEIGKPSVGEILLDVSQEGNEAVITLADDGAGLDTARIGERARELGIAGLESRRSDAEIAELIFVPGLSTAEAVSESAGRGVGMDVVRNEVASLGGRIEVSFERGRGTRFSIRLPLTLAVAQAVLVKAAGCTCAIPTVMVEHVMQLHATQLQSLRGEPRPELEWQQRRYAFHELPVLLQLAQTSPGSASPVLFVRSGVNAIALRADEILASSREIVVKPIGPHLARLKGITGATVLGSGDIVLILNPVELALRASQTAAPVPAPAAPLAQALEAAPAPAAVMVVDDSLTVRKFTGRLLERQGYRVLTARDGVEALEQLQSETPAVMLVDIEMPRMDGFELTRRVRAETRLAGVAIIMITSRAAEKHERHATELGVDHYFGKPFKEDELLAQIARFTASGRAPRVVCE